MFDWFPDSTGTIPGIVHGAERSMLAGTPALSEWLSANVPGDVGLTLQPFGESSPYVRRLHVHGGAVLYQLGGGAVLTDKDGNRLFVATLSKPFPTAVEALRHGWTVVSGVRAGVPVPSGVRALERRRAAATALLVRYGHLLTPTSWVQVPYINGDNKIGLYERTVAELRRAMVDSRRGKVQTLSIAGQVWNHTRKRWSATSAKLSPSGVEGAVVVAPTTVLQVRRGDYWVSLHDRQTGECLYRFEPEQWEKYERKFGHA